MTNITFTEKLHATIESGKLNVFFFAGQSNTEGKGDVRKITTEEFAEFEKAKAHIQFAYNKNPIAPLYFRDIPQWELKKFDQIAGMEKYFGPELFFALELHKQFPDEKFLFIKRSVGGTSLYGCWNPNWSEDKAKEMKEAEKTKLYADFIEYGKNVLSQYDKSNYKLCGMIWVQGEADQKANSNSYNTYGENLINLINGVRSEFEVTDLPFMWLEIGRLGPQMKKIESLVNASMVPQNKNDKDSEFYYPMYGPPIGHYNYEGMKRIGTNFYKEYASKHLKR